MRCQLGEGTSRLIGLQNALIGQLSYGNGAHSVGPPGRATQAR
jgi:hypothetical protein